jgi:hypothetical protein
MILLVSLTLTLPAFAQSVVKSALVIGNTHYPSPNALNNPTHDADIVGNALSQLGFTLVGNGPMKDVDLPTFKKAVSDFAEVAGKSDVVVFYFSGHGIQMEGENYLVPIDADPIHGASDVPVQMIAASEILSILDKTEIRLKIIILDACRDNPFATKGYLAPTKGLAIMSQGLTAMRAPIGTVIWYATQPGATASDVGANGGPFSNALAENVVKPGDDIYAVFNHTGIAVMKSTNKRQQPWLAATPLDGDFYFRQVGTANKSFFVNSTPDNQELAHLFANGLRTSTKSFEFGQNYTAVNAELDSHFSIESWASLPKAGEYLNDDVRYFWVPLLGIPTISSTILNPSLTQGHCIDPQSYVSFMFKDQKLFTISIRFARSVQCGDYDWVFDSLFGGPARSHTIQTRQGETSVVAHNESGYSVLDITRLGQAKAPISIYTASY